MFVCFPVSVFFELSLQRKTIQVFCRAAWSGAARTSHTAILLSLPWSSPQLSLSSSQTELLQPPPLYTQNRAGSTLPLFEFANALDSKNCTHVLVLWNCLFPSDLSWFYFSSSVILGWQKDSCLSISGSHEEIEEKRRRRSIVSELVFLFVCVKGKIVFLGVFPFSALVAGRNHWTSSIFSYLRLSSLFPTYVNKMSGGGGKWR